MVDCAQAFAIFRESFTGVPSRQAIAVARQAGHLPVIFSDYQWEGQRRISDDFFIHGGTPSAAIEAIRAYQPVALHYLLVVADQLHTAEAYAAYGYEIALIEYLMARDLHQLPSADSSLPIIEIRTAEQATAANRGDAETEPWVRPANLAATTIQHYAIMIDGITAARARNWNYAAHGSYVTHVFTHPSYRRRGLARAIMLHLLRESAARGEQESVLVASEEGDLLYRQLGYQRLATLLVLQPRHAAA